MRVSISGLIIILFLVCTSCISIKARVTYDVGSVASVASDSKSTIDDFFELSPITEANLPKKHPCHLDKLALCPPSEIQKLRLGLEAPCSDRAAKTPGIAQKTLSWCWAASAEAVLAAHDRTVRQCDGVNQVLGRSDCCAEMGPNNRPPEDCRKNGWPNDIFNRNNVDWNWVKGHLSLNAIAGQLCQAGPIIITLGFEDGSYHTLVARGIRQVGENWELEVHDHSWNFGEQQGNLQSDPQEGAVIPEFSSGGGPPKEFFYWPYEDYINGRWFIPVKETFSFVQILPRT